uniref:Uncharacterized protein n=1 Tax=Anguilla anguilla TaxID=7936 RepID=A0A0E9UP23_ANGAN
MQETCKLLQVAADCSSWCVPQLKICPSSSLPKEKPLLRISVPHKPLASKLQPFFA